RLQHLDALQRLQAVAAFAHDLHVALGIQQVADARTRMLFVVHDEYPDHLAPPRADDGPAAIDGECAICEFAPWAPGHAGNALVSGIQSVTCGGISLICGESHTLWTAILVTGTPRVICIVSE